MTAKFIPASITIEVHTDAVTLDAETVSALLDGSAGRTTLARVRDLIAPRTITITEGTRVRLKVNPGNHPDFLFGMHGWDDDMTVASVTDTEVRTRSELAQDFTVYVGPFEKILDVLEVLEDKSPETQPETQPAPAADPEGWVAWDFSNRNGPDLPEGARVAVKLRDGCHPTATMRVKGWRWTDEGSHSDIVYYRVV